MVNSYERSTPNNTFRIWVAFGFVLLCISILILRLWYLQIVRGEFFRDRSENNRLRTIYIPPTRGIIYDRNGDVLVRNRPSFNVDLVIEDSPNPQQTVADLALIVGEDPGPLQERVLKDGKRRRFEPKLLMRDVSRDLVAKISAQRYRLPGIAINVVSTREYLYGEMLAHVLGYIREVSSEQLKSPAYSNYLMGDLVGQYGVEANLERYLRGERGSQAVIVNALGNRIGEAYLNAEKPGSNVMLTIDRKIQAVADQALTGLKGGVVVMDVRSGDILALASAPRYHPAIFTTEISKEAWSDLIDPKANRLSNRILQGAFPPGSVFKIFVAAAALSEGVITPSEKIRCPGYLKFGKRAFRCHKHSGHGSVNLFEAIVQSCDVYFYTVGQRLGVDRIYRYAHDMFGFGEPTGITQGEESSGIVPSTAWKASYFKNPADKRWFPGETLPVAIGQGAVSTTPIQIARALAAVVNGGKIIRPRLVKKIVAGDGRMLEEASAEPEVVRTVDLEPAILEQLKAAMVGVVEDRRGTGHKAALPKEFHIMIGGKTGTAQVASRESGIKDEDHAWFAAYAPADKPQIVVAVILENGGHGGAAAAPVARKIFAAYFGVPEEIPAVPKIRKQLARPAPSPAAIN